MYIPSHKNRVVSIYGLKSQIFFKKKKDRLAAFFYKSILRRKSKKKSKNIPDFL